MKKDIILAGVGGQGILSIATIIGDCALSGGLYLKQAEVHGMSQRGGDVMSCLRLSSNPIHSDLIPRGRVDLIISLEPMEALRYVDQLAADGRIVTSTEPFVNIPNYPDHEAILKELESRGDTVLLPCEAIAKEAASPRASNMVLLGAAAPWLGLPAADIEAGIRRVFGAKGEKIVNDNIAAFRAGMNYKPQTV